MRKLASIQRVWQVEPIEGADSVEKIKVMGWQVVARKNEFKAGDLCIFFECDSILPDKPEFEFLKDRKFRIKTIKIRKVLSQGIAFPLSILPENIPVELGRDVTSEFGITKYEISYPVHLQGEIKNSFPSFIPKTDEIRLQSAIDVLDEFKDKEIYITMKEDGTSFTAYYNNGIFGVCSRNNECREGNIIYWKIAKQYDIENKLKRLNKNIAIQGEITGSGIQKNRLGLLANTHQMHVFNVYDIANYRYMNFLEAFELMQDLNLDTVKVLYTGIFNFTLEQLIEMAKGKYPNTNNDIEGIVMRPTIETFSNTLQGRLSIKVLNNDFLLKEE